MTADSKPPRRYTDEEVRALLERAAQLESQGATLPAPVQGTTLKELESIASEAGIDAGLVRQAAHELDSPLGRPPAPRTGLAKTLLGAPLAVELTRTLEREASPEALESLVLIIQSAADGIGQPFLKARTLSWQGADSARSRRLQVTVSVGRGETRLALEERYGELAGGLFGGLGGGGGLGIGLGVGLGVGVGALGSALFATVFPLAAIGTTVGLSRMIYRRVVESRAQKLERLMDEMVAALDP